jgi:hypothetical protein
VQSSCKEKIERVKDALEEIRQELEERGIDCDALDDVLSDSDV